MTARRVLVLSYGGGHAQIGVAMLGHLVAAGWTPTVLGLTMARPIYEAAGYAVRGFRDYVGPGDEAALVRGARLRAELGSNPAVPDDESDAYLGLSYRDLEAAEGEEAAARIYAERGRHAFLPVPTLRRILRAERPDLLLTTNSPRAEEAALLAAGELGIPSVCVGDLYQLAEAVRFTRPGYADRVCVPAPVVRRRLLEVGRRPEEIVVTGNPVFDRLVDPAFRAAGMDLRTAWGVRDRPVVLWASQPDAAHPDLGVRVASALAEACGELGWRLVVRPHPNEPPFEEDLPAGAVLSDPSTPLEPVLHAADVAVTVTSTVGLQAVLAGKRLVELDIPTSLLSARYAEQGLAVACRSLDGLRAALVEALEGPEPPGAAELPPPGRAGERILAVIDDLMATRA